MRATPRHAGLLIELRLVDPVRSVFLPGSTDRWFVFPAKDQLPAELMGGSTSYLLYISHLTLSTREVCLRITSTVTPPAWCRFRPGAEEDPALGFRPDHRKTMVKARTWRRLRISIHVETSITDGPGGDSALVVNDGTARLLNQNDCRTDDLDALRAHGPVDLHWLQYSGAIWYPMVYDEPPRKMRGLIDAKVASQYARAMRYVEAIGATAVVPVPAPPAFLDPESSSQRHHRRERAFPRPAQRHEPSDGRRREGSWRSSGTSIDIRATRSRSPSLRCSGLRHLRSQANYRGTKPTGPVVTDFSSLNPRAPIC